ncbi:MAG: hypothetical protein O2800_07610 [Planctomycetota bacterium]|nr:hypothetical protein [Planctomycetota bacterium]
MKQIFRSIALCVLSLCALAPLPIASAQFGGELGFREAFRPDFLNRDIELFATVLELEEWQKPIIEILLDDYQSEYRIGEASLRNRLVDLSSQLQAANQQNAMQLLLAPFQQWQIEKARIGEVFMRNVKLQLSDDQISRWPGLERALRREKELSSGKLSGESVDLILVTKDIDVPRDVLKVAQPVMVEYEMALDASLVARASKINAMQDQLRDAQINGNIGAGVVGMESIVQSRIELREMQDRSALLIAEALGTTWGSVFTESARQRAYPTVFRPNPFFTLVDQVLTIATLSDDQKLAILSLRSRFDVDLEQVEQELLRKHHAEEPKRELSPARNAAARSRGEDASKPGDPYVEIIVRRESLGDKARTELMGLLTPEQIESLPNASKLLDSGESSRRDAPAGKMNNRFSASDARGATTDSAKKSGGSRDGRAPQTPQNNPPIADE